MLKRLSLALGISLCTVSAATIAIAGDTFRILSYNVENLWDDEPDNTPDTWSRFLSSLDDDDRDNINGRYLQYSDYSSEKSNWYDSEILEAKIQHFLEVIRLADEPEILALQEIESAGNKSHVFDMRGTHSVLRNELEKLGYHYFILGKQTKKTPVSVTPAIISKLPLTELASVKIEYENEPYSTSARDIQAVEFREGSNRMVIFNNHWKSKAGGPAKTEPARIRTAELLRQRIDKERQAVPGTRIIVAGDLNSAYYEEPIKVLATADEGLMVTKRNASLLYNLWYELGEDDRWETSYRGERQTLSALLISDDFYNQSGIQYEDQSFKVIGQTGAISKKLLNADGTPFRWQVKKKKKFATHLGKGFSDHLPLLATFHVKGALKKGKKTLTHLPTSKHVEGEKPKVLLDRVPLCSEQEIVDIKVVDFRSDDWFNKCVKIEGSFPLEAGKGEADAIHLAPSLDIVITMTRSWDDRPNIDDSRISQLEVFREGRVRDRNGHHRSNRCFARKVLSGPGGTLRFAEGRLGYYEGRIAVFVPTREERHLVLSALPINKRMACPWNE